jgi:3-hydroxybutyryl-CoA dehydratase
MKTKAAVQQLNIGDELAGFERVVTPERLVWYGDGMLTAAAGQRTRVGSNIHTDDDYARQQGLPGAISEGMVATNWISSMLLHEFGADYVTNGELRTKYIKPTPVGTKVHVRGRIRNRIDLDAGRVRYEIEVWTEDDAGVRLTDGEAAVQVGVDRR